MGKRIGTWFALTILYLLSFSPVVTAADYHTVRSGDSLWKIARLYNTTVAKLMAWNHLTSERLQIGDRLKVSGGTAAVASRGQQSRGTGQGEVYLVKQGDSLWSIARRYGMTVAELKEINHLQTEGLHPGDKLYVRSNRIADESGVNANTVRTRGVSQPSRGVATGLSQARNIISTAMEYLGTEYRSGGASPGGFDCSGFVMYVFSQHGISLPHSSRAQAGLGVQVEKSELQPGDLVFFATGEAGHINHVGIYTGEGNFIHASTNRGITVTGLGESYYSSCYICARRILQ